MPRSGLILAKDAERGEVEGNLSKEKVKVMVDECHLSFTMDGWIERRKLTWEINLISTTNRHHHHHHQALNIYL